MPHVQTVIKCKQLAVLSHPKYHLYVNTKGQLEGLLRLSTESVCLQNLLWTNVLETHFYSDWTINLAETPFIDD